MKMDTAVCFSGYREEKFPFALQDGNVQYEQLKKDLLSSVLEAVEEGYGNFYTGACYGFDILAGEMVIKARDEYGLPIRLTSVLPFENQAQLWKEYWRDRYYSMLEFSDQVVTLQTRYTRGCYQRRNRYMIERSDLLICYHTGCPGGTSHTVYAAIQNGLYVVNICKDLFIEEPSLLYTLSFS